MKGTVIVQAAQTGSGEESTRATTAPPEPTPSRTPADGPSLPSTGMDALGLGLLGF